MISNAIILIKLGVLEIHGVKEKKNLDYKKYPKTEDVFH